MRPRIYVPLSREDEATISRWTRCVLGGYAAVLAGGIAMLVVRSHQPVEHANAAEHVVAPACARWDESARGAITTLLQSKREADLRVAARALERVRHAQQNCRLGAIELACQEYNGIVKIVAGVANSWPPASLACSPSDTEPTVAAVP
jgi:hypothetical protein